MLRKIIDFILFSSLFISCCAVLMVYETLQLVNYNGAIFSLYGFVFFSTICSYNFHWYFTPHVKNERIRTLWTQEHRSLQLVLAIAGALGAIYFLPHFLDKIHWLFPSVLLTFLYTAPKIPVKAFRYLKKIAIGKTIYLAFVWTYVTTIMPILLFEIEWTGREFLFTTGRFFYIYAICILFDYRDRDQDKIDGIRSLVTYFEEKGIARLYVGSLCIFFATTLMLAFFDVAKWQILLMIIPGILLAILFPIARKNFSDYLYYLVLDGLMMFSALCTVLLSI
jgi:4-hydroxybenzoate polyprenyltransferase